VMRLFMARAGDLGLLGEVPILGGVFVLRTAKTARYLRDQVPGINVPDAVIDRMESVPPERQGQEGVRIAIELVRELREISGIRGVHLMGVRSQAAILQVIEEAGLLPRPTPVTSVAVG